MTVKELREKILSNGGEVIFGKAKITYSYSNDVDVFTYTGDLVCWVNYGREESNDVLKSISVENEIFEEERITAIVDFAQYLGVKVGVEPITIEKEVLKVQEVKTVDVESQLEASKLRGMVDAYEKIVLGRDITVSK